MLYSKTSDNSHISYLAKNRQNKRLLISKLFVYINSFYSIALYSERTWYNEPKVIVSHHKLEELLSVCPMCSSKSAVEMKELQGAYVRYQTSCLTCTHSRDWANSEKVGRIALINILLCAGILFTGCLPTKVTRMMSQLSIKFPSKRSFIHYQTTYLHGVS